MKGKLKIRTINPKTESLWNETMKGMGGAADGRAQDLPTSLLFRVFRGTKQKFLMNYNKMVERSIDAMKKVERQLFCYRARRFVHSVIRQRQKLLDAGQSKKNPMRMMATIDRLRTHLQAYPHSSSKAVAGWFLKNQEEIRSLIPGNYNTNRKRFDDFAALREEARMITTRQAMIQLS